MRRLILGTCVSMLVVLAAGFTFGGWAVVSVTDIPDVWIAGKPVQLTWEVRQHAVTPLYGLNPKLEARSGSRTVEGTTSEFNENGQRGYRGAITFPTSGEWQVTIYSGFGRSKAILVPWGVVDSRTKGVPGFTEAERGRRMFAASGCVTCHMHNEVGIKGELSDFGPDLTVRRFPASYLANFLANPSIKPPTNGKQMPNPHLRAKDIAPLIAFINAERRVTSR